MKNDEELNSKSNYLSDCELRAKRTGWLADLQDEQVREDPLNASNQDSGGTRDSGRGVKAAFTLAEVLIVLSIIGVVAAFTIPTLMTKVQNHEYVVGLKKFYTTQMDGWSRLLADDGVDQLGDTSVFQSMIEDDDNYYCELADANITKCKPFFNNLKKYFKFDVVKAPSYQIYQLNGAKYAYNDYTGNTALAFADGSVMFDGNFQKFFFKPTATRTAQIAAGGGHMYSFQGAFWIDVNGFKKPNTMGRDIFLFELSKDSKLYPYGGKDY